MGLILDSNVVFAAERRGHTVRTGRAQTIKRIVIRGPNLRTGLNAQPGETGDMHSIAECLECF